MENKSKTAYGICAALVIIASIAFIFFGNKLCLSDESGDINAEVYYNAEVISITDDSGAWDVYNSETGQIISKRIYFQAKLTSGDSKGKTVEACQFIDYTYAYVLDPVEEGDRIIVTSVYDFSTNDYNWEFGGYNRTNAMILLLAVFLALVLAIGRKKGLVTIISLIFTAGAVFLVYIPSILKGMNIYASTVIISVFTVFMTLLLLNGPNKKTFSAIIGNIGGLLIAGLIALIMNSILDVNGLADEDYVNLKMLDSGVSIDLRAVIWGGMVIGALGAVMDVAMSIASSMQELAENMREKTFKNMFRSGMNIGKDAIGTMTNTLILAYIGGGLVTVLLLVAYNKDLLYLFNMETIVIEIIQALSGSIGIICAVPLTTIIASFVFNRKEKQ